MPTRIDPSTPRGLRAARERLGLIQDDFAIALGLKAGGRLVRYYESGERRIPTYVTVLVNLLLEKRTMDRAP